MSENIKYVLHPNFIRSADGDTHYVDARTLARLYGVKWDECVVSSNISAMRSFGAGEYSELKHLYPRANGAYHLNLCVPEKGSCTAEEETWYCIDCGPKKSQDTYFRDVHSHAVKTCLDCGRDLLREIPAYAIELQKRIVDLEKEVDDRVRHDRLLNISMTNLDRLQRNTVELNRTIRELRKGLGKYERARLQLAQYFRNRRRKIPV